MAPKDENTYSPVGRLSSESGTGFLTGSHRERSPTTRRTWVGPRVTLLLSAALLVSNGIWAGIFGGYNIASSKHTSPASPETDMLNHADHDRLSTAFHWNTPFSDDNKTVSNPLWSGLFPRKEPTKDYLAPFPPSSSLITLFPRFYLHSLSILFIYLLTPGK